MILGLTVAALPGTNTDSQAQPRPPESESLGVASRTQNAFPQALLEIWLQSVCLQDFASFQSALWMPALRASLGMASVSLPPPSPSRTLHVYLDTPRLASCRRH